MSSSSPSPTSSQHQTQPQPPGSASSTLDSSAPSAASAPHLHVPSSPSHNSSSNSSPSSNSQFGDTTQTKVFVGGLAWETNRDGVRRHFEQYGEILEAVVITDKSTGRSKGYGFVTFRDPEGAKRACEDSTPMIDGRRANCNLASLGVRSRPGTPQHGRYSRGPNPARSPARVQPPFNIPSPASPHPPPPPHLPYSYQQPPIQYPPYGYSHYQQDFIYAHPSAMMYNAPFFVNPPFPSVYGGAAGGGASATGAAGPPPPPSLQGNPTAIYPFHSPPPLSPNPAAPFQAHLAAGAQQNQPILSGSRLTASARVPVRLA